MKEEKRMINGKPIQCIEKCANFPGGKDILIWNINQSFIQLDQNQVQQYEEYYNLTHPRNPFIEERINSQIVRQDKPINLTAQQKKFQRKILQGDDKESFLTEASVILRNQSYSKTYSDDCTDCKIKDWEIQKLTNRIKELQIQNQYITNKITVIRQQNDKRQKELFAQIFKIKKKLKNKSDKKQQSSIVNISNVSQSMDAKDFSILSNLKKSNRSFKKKSEASIIFQDKLDTKASNRNQSLILLNISKQEEKKKILKVPAGKTQQIEKSKSFEELQYSLLKVKLQTKIRQDSGQFCEIQQF